MIVVRINPQPDGIHRDHGQRGVLEYGVPGKSLPKARLLVEVMHVVHWLHEVCPNGSLHALGIRKHASAEWNLPHIRTRTVAFPARPPLRIFIFVARSLRHLAHRRRRGGICQGLEILHLPDHVAPCRRCMIHLCILHLSSVAGRRSDCYEHRLSDDRLQVRAPLLIARGPDGDEVRANGVQLLLLLPTPPTCMQLCRSKGANKNCDVCTGCGSGYPLLT
mmetsp:Transcript_88935/g.160370  ORF Transcript_88935/g.160370 Transcript_88935/m.160370 type:complete len:220 (+) Transcript_88935:331-990(+)